MLLTALILSAALLLVTNVAASRETATGRGLACLLAALGVGIGFCLQAPLLPLNALLILVVAIACFFKEARSRGFLVASLSATAATYAILIVGSVVPDLRAWAGLRESYPLESLGDRLAYEDRVPHPVTSPVNDEKHLAGLEQGLPGSEARRRTRSLEHLHQSTVLQFIDSPGFGVARTVSGPWRDALQAREYPPIPLSTPSKDPGHDLPASPGTAAEAVSREGSFLRLHDENVIDFLNAPGFGYVRDRDHVAGFQPHQFRNDPQPSAPERWWIDRLELVSLLKFDEPAVYLSKHLPRMDELREAKTRPLNAFERDALTALQRGEDLKVWASPDRIHMLGAIRAVKQCLACHNAERGELLGAFSYELRR